jgi:Tol biopolymer transport system component
MFFASDRGRVGGRFDLWVMNPDGSDPTLLSTFPGEKGEAVFLPTR